jgi:hypothetical protein
MILPPDLASSVPIPNHPSFADAVREFGFHTDIDYIDEPLRRHNELWTGALSGEMEAMHGRFLDLTDDIMRIAYEENLRSDRRQTGAVSGRHRRDITNAFEGSVRERHREEALEAYREAHGGQDPYDEPNDRAE